MIKNHFKSELSISATQRRGGNNSSKEVTKIQSWLNLFAYNYPGAGTATAIDGDFGPATERAVKNYQSALGNQSDGIVTPELFARLSQSMADTFVQSSPEVSLRDRIIDVAFRHLNAGARELIIKGKSNSGPWVRAYMDGNEGNDWLWCMGFVQAILDQAMSQSGQKFTDVVKRSFSCDVVAVSAKSKGNFISYTTLRKNPALVERGDIFLLQSTNNSNDWVHTGIIIGVYGDVFETIEGNTNTDGSSNGYGVFKRTRNFQKSKLDIVKI